MAIGVVLLIIAVAVIFIWVSVELKRLKHKLFAIFLIGLIIIGYLSTFVAFRGQDIDLTTVSGLMHASGIYFSFLSSLAGNFVTITSNAVHMDWTNPYTNQSNS